MKRTIRHVCIIRITMNVVGKVVDIFPVDFWSQTDRLYRPYKFITYRAFVGGSVHRFRGLSTIVDQSEYYVTGTKNGGYEKNALHRSPWPRYNRICFARKFAELPSRPCVLRLYSPSLSAVLRAFRQSRDPPVRQRKLLVPLMNRRPFCLQVANFEK